MPSLLLSQPTVLHVGCSRLFAKPACSLWYLHAGILRGDTAATGCALLCITSCGRHSLMITSKHLCTNIAVSRSATAVTQKEDICSLRIQDTKVCKQCVSLTRCTSVLSSAWLHAAVDISSTSAKVAHLRRPARSWNVSESRLGGPSDDAKVFRRRCTAAVLIFRSEAQLPIIGSTLSERKSQAQDVTPALANDCNRVRGNRGTLCCSFYA